jgi:hypothetical protein
MYFGPNNNPRLSIGPRNQVTVDAAGKIHLIDDLEEYRKSCRAPTWNAVVQLADELREKNFKIGFFSSTPQGGKPRCFPRWKPIIQLFSLFRWRCSCVSSLHVI